MRGHGYVPAEPPRFVEPFRDCFVGPAAGASSYVDGFTVGVHPETYRKMRLLNGQRVTVHTFDKKGRVVPFAYQTPFAVVPMLPPEKADVGDPLTITYALSYLGAVLPPVAPFLNVGIGERLVLNANYEMGVLALQQKLQNCLRDFWSG